MQLDPDCAGVVYNMLAGTCAIVLQERIVIITMAIITRASKAGNGMYDKMSS